MPVAFPYTGYPDGAAYPQIPTGTTTVNVNSASALNTALANAVAGHRIVLASGTYSGAFAVTGKNGSSSAGIMIEAATTGGAVFASGSTWNINNSSYVTLKGLSFPYDLASGNLVQFRGTTHHSRVTRCLFGPTSIGTPGASKSPFVYMGDNVDFIRIDHNELRNKANPGNSILGDGNFTTFQVVKHIRIDHNYIHDISPEVNNEKEPIRLGVSTMSKTFSNSVVERNLFVNCIAEPEVFSGKACGIRFSGNVIMRSIGGPVLRHGTNCVMNDNYIVDDRVGGSATPPPDPDPDPDPPPPPPPGTQTLGVGGIPRPAAGPNVTLYSANQGALTITQGGTQGNPRIHDGGGFTVGRITISASWVTVQNFNVRSNNQYGIYCNPADGITIQNNNIKDVRGPGDLNAITLFGNDCKVLYNDCTNFVTGDPGGSHTDGLQVWNTSSKRATNRLIVKGNHFVGPLLSESANFTIHQCIMAEGNNSNDGGGGGSGDSRDWWIEGNTFRDDWNQCLKFDDIQNVHITRNTFRGSSDRQISSITGSTVSYYNDNVTTGSYGQVGVTVLSSPGPASPPFAVN